MTGHCYGAGNLEYLEQNLYIMEPSELEAIRDAVGVIQAVGVVDPTENAQLDRLDRILVDSIPKAHARAERDQEWQAEMEVTRQADKRESGSR